ncbi:hypothetical protein L1857_09500 [Amycolatopsis thermalba]|uniref:Uncharacterized protein n=1 Tax=Amycolatopsis thermalba TaxID=944492 RepID=A0ABY4NSH5_9PSEU|nr:MULTISPECIES: hypothetical protein [Amycolatopsis]UQS23034.1 hypothetical protein L1857_09500 [Amycolatopsis thermalba]
MRATTTTTLRLVIDLVLGVLTLAVLALGIRGVARARHWATRMAGRPWWRVVLQLAPGLVTVVVLVTLPGLLGAVVGGGRDLTFEQVAYYSPALVDWIASATLVQAAALVARSTAFRGVSPGRARPAGTPAFVRGPGS